MKIDLNWIPCHRRPDRSFYLGGKKMPLCARCASILAGYTLAPILVGFHVMTSYYLIGFLLLPMLIDGFTQLWKWRTSNNALRFLTGLSFGVSQALLISNVVWLLLDTPR
ncbi:DUF2085 domain-containing protein [Brevibacillus sp. NPDC058079]|uniref:DUF2085 domain-containing protein n=1 Tax=Brevibacillus sp. NPDC058079 TaxID=3346330 RepID=UPI0036EC3FA5